jgi:hypothetical protein
MGSAQLRRAVDAFIDEVNASPSASVGAALERLKAARNEGDRGMSYAEVSPVANETWMQTLTLPAAQTSSIANPLQIPYPCKLIGCVVEPLLVTFAQGIVEAPPEAIRVFLNINRHEDLTMRVDKNLRSQDNPQLASIMALDQGRDKNRSFCLEFDENDNTFSAQAFWAVDLTVVAAAGWGDMLIQLNWIVEPKNKGLSGSR